MLSMLFWNLRGNQVSTWSNRVARLRQSVKNFAIHFDIDLLLFAESGFEPSDGVGDLNQQNRGVYRVPPSIVDRFQIYSRLPDDAVTSQYDSPDSRLTIRRVRRPGGEILLAVLHFQSQLFFSETEQALLATELRKNVELTEDTVGHQRTVLIGDLNMNPFDPGVAAAGALHAVMTQGLAGPEGRVVAGQQYRLFYNPMWGHFGDRTPGPPGTLYYSTSTPVNYYWNIFDQVLLRPELAPALRELTILDHDGQESLLTATGRPRVAELSDHLPILCRLDV